MNDNCTAIALFLAAHPEGSTVDKVAAAVGLAPSTTSDRLSKLRRQGFADCAGVGRGWLWGAPDAIAVVKAEVSSKAIERRRLRDRAAQKTKRREAAEEIMRCGFVRIWTTVDKVPKVVKRGPASVWELAL